MASKHNLRTRASKDRKIESICHTCKQIESSRNTGTVKDNWFGCAVCGKKFHASCEGVLDNDYCDVKSTKFYFCLSCIKQSNVSTTQTVIVAPAVTSKPDDITFTDGGSLNRDVIAAQAHKQMQLFWPQIEQCIDKMVSRIVDECMAPVKQELNHSIETIAHLEKRIVELEGRARSHNIIIRGCPDKMLLEPRDIVRRIAVITDCQLTDDEIISARRLLRSTNQDKGIDSKTNRSNFSSSPILATFSSIGAKISFLKKFFNMIKFKRIRVGNLIQNGSLDKNISDVADSEIFVGDHLEKHIFDCFLRVRRLKKNGVINKFIIRTGHIWIAIKEGDILTRVDTIAELQQKIISVENNDATPQNIDVSSLYGTGLVN